MDESFSKTGFKGVGVGETLAEGFKLPFLLFGCASRGGDHDQKSGPGATSLGFFDKGTENCPFDVPKISMRKAEYKYQKQEQSHA